MTKQQKADKSAGPTKRGGLLGLFDAIKGFFAKLIAKFKESREYHRRLENGQKNWEGTVEGQAQQHSEAIDKEFGYRTAEQIKENQVHFPGYEKMEISEGGLLRIPQHTELLWQCPTTEETAKRYLTCMNERFADRSDPNTTHNGKAFADIAKDMRKAMAQQDNDPHMFVLGNTWISARAVSDKWQFTMSTGERTMKFISSDKYTMASDIMVHYAELTCDRQAAVYNDANTQTMFVAMRGDAGYESFTARPVMSYTQEPKAPMQNVVQLSGSRLPAREIVDKIIAAQTGPAKDADMRELAYKAYKGAVAQSDTATIYIMGDKMLWATQYDGQCTLHLAPAHCPYPGVDAVNVPVTEKMFHEETGNIKKTALYYAVQKGMKTLDGRVEAAAKLAAQTEHAAEIEKNLDGMNDRQTDNTEQANNADLTENTDNMEYTEYVEYTARTDDTDNNRADDICPGEDDVAL